MRARSGGGEFGGELEQRGGAGLAGAEAELAEPFGELVGADRSAGTSAGEQPWRGSLVAEGGVAAAGGDELEDEVGERFGQDDGFAAEAEPYLVGRRCGRGRG